ncbi:PepSY domain-containing protein [Micromonospora sp. NPDC051296]|uniref:PepSY domain-containing protein n=1 Tax=Micromonospora sp. NPDC051296 TaxID=3155046 RepID=UPI003431CD3A
MRRAVLVAITIAGVAVPLVAGTALATAKDSRQRAGARSGAGFEIEIDPRLDAKFGPRPVNAVQAAEIVTRRFAGARVTEAELDERNGGPIWEIEFVLGGREREVDVDAVTGAILADDGRDDDRDDDQDNDRDNDRDDDRD